MLDSLAPVIQLYLVAIHVRGVATLETTEAAASVEVGFAAVAVLKGFILKN